MRLINLGLTEDDVVKAIKEGYVGYGSYIIDAISGVISQGIRLD